MTHTTTPHSSGHPGAGAERPRRTHRHRVVNVPLLGATLGVLAVVVPLGWFWHRYQQNQATAALLDRVTQLEQQEQWGKAAGYLRQYLRDRPQDVDSRVRLIDDYEKVAESGDALMSLGNMLYETVGLAPSRTDLQLRLADNRLKLSDWAEAQNWAQKVLDGSSEPAEQQQARRVLALAKYQQAAQDNRESDLRTGLGLMFAAQREVPGDRLLATTLASALRSRSQLAPSSVADAAAEATRVMDDLIAAAPDDLDARLSRYLYRQQHELPGADEDLAAAQQIDPESPNVLLLAASRAATEDPGSAQAQELFQKFVEVEPKDPRGYLALAELAIRRDDRAEALDVLRSGRNAVGRDDFALNRAYAALLIEDGNLEPAERAVEETANAFNQAFGQSPAQMRANELQLQLLRAQLLIAQERTSEALEQLRLLVTSRTGADENAALYRQAYELLARGSAAMGEREQAAAYWRQLAEQFPNDAAASSAAAASLRRLGRPSEAVPLLEQLARRPDATLDVQIELLSALLQQQLEIPPSRRSWDRFVEQLAALRQQAPDDPRVAFSGGEYYASLGTPDARQAGLELLSDVEPKLGDDDANLYSAITYLYRRLGDEQSAERTWQRYEALEPEGSPKMLRRAERLVRTSQLDEALQLLTDAAAAAPAADREPLQLARLSVLALEGELNAAYEAAAALAKAQPDSERMLGAAAELALATRNYPAVAALEQQSEALKLRDKLRWQLVSLRRRGAQLATLTPAQVDDFRRDLEKLQADYPQLPLTAVLSAQLAEHQGNPIEAMSRYEQAIGLGDRSLETFQRLVALLYRAGRFPEARAYQEAFQPRLSDALDLQTTPLARAMEQNRAARALTSARDEVANQPDSADARAWLGGLLSVRNEGAEALEVLDAAVAQFPQALSVQSARLAHLLNARDTEAAKAALDALAAQQPQPSGVLEGGRQLLLGLGYEGIANAVNARQAYDAAIAADPDNAYLRERYANFLLTRDVAAAREQCEKLLELDRTNPRARRLLASLLAAGGADEDWRRAIDMLDDNRNLDDPNDYRLRALLLTRRGRDRLERIGNFEAARRIVEQAISRAGDDAADIDRILLADLCRQQAELAGERAPLEAAAAQWRTLAQRDPPNVAYLLRAADFMVRIAAGIEGINLGATLPAQALADTRAAFERLQKLIAPTSPLDQRLALLSLEARLLALEGENDEAVAALERAAAAGLSADASVGEQAQFALTLGNLFTAANRLEEAETWYRKLAEVNPRGYLILASALGRQGRLEDAVKVCLQSAGGQNPGPEALTAVCELMVSNLGRADLFAKLRPLIDETLQQYPSEANLLTAAAVLYAAYGENARSLELFERLVELTPDNALALNNLATMLGEIPNRRAEALKYIDHALSVAGRLADLLDTRGTILIYEGRYDEAIAALEEAVAGRTADPRYYFHLAVAYGKAGRLPQAAEALAQARQRGLDGTILTPGDQSAREELEKQLQNP